MPPPSAATAAASPQEPQAMPRDSTIPAPTTAAPTNTMITTIIITTSTTITIIMNGHHQHHHHHPTIITIIRASEILTQTPDQPPLASVSHLRQIVVTHRRLRHCVGPCLQRSPRSSLAYPSLFASCQQVLVWPVPMHAPRKWPNHAFRPCRPSRTHLLLGCNGCGHLCGRRRSSCTEPSVKSKLSR